MKYRALGYKGYYGVDFCNSKHDKKLRKADKLVDEYNSKINTFKTEKGNNNFAERINKKIAEILK